MKPVAFFSGLFILMAAAIQVTGQNKYYLKEQWYTSSSPQFPVNGSPKIVKEYFYTGLNNFDGSDTAKFSSFDSFTYDNSGNILERMLFFDSTFWMLFTYNYSSKGYTTVLTSSSKGKITKETVKKFEKYNAVQFKESNPYDKYKDVKLYSYSNNGNEVLIIETVTGKKQLSFYDRQRPLKKIISGGKDTTIKTYYYNAKLKLNSIVSVAGTTRNVLQFVINKKGDPVSEIQILNGDTANYITYSYIYDDNGNWIKRIEEEHIESKFSSPSKPFALITRKITY